VAYADWNRNYGATSAPLVVKGKVLVGTSGGDDGVRGLIAAYDAVTGKFLWRFWTIPGPGEPGSESWPGDNYLHGGGTTWMPGTYDPDLNLVYWGISNPSPDFFGDVRPGDDLYTCSVVALDLETGKLKWHFQFTPHDLYDYDAQETAILVDAEYKGRPRKLLLEANRNGYIYVLDRATGEFLSATRFAEKVNWTKGIDEKGRPIIDKDSARPTPSGSVVCPGFSGATNWYSPSFDPVTRTMYFMALEECTVLLSGPQTFKEGETYYGTGSRRPPAEHGKKILLAFDLDTSTFRWRYPQAPGRWAAGGTMATVSGIVFFGDDSESFEAVDAKTGKPLWHFNTGQTFHASPMSYAVHGKQFVAIAAGSDVFSFALP
jgi:alcohol dehydrogenase (cytochrome c)